jgi:hypothetical protein
MKRLKYLAAAIGLALGSQASEAATLFFEPAGSLVTVGDDVTVTSKINDVRSPIEREQQVLAFTFDPTVLSLTQVDQSPQWIGPSFSLVAGSNVVWSPDRVSGPAGNSEIATFTFHANAAGTSQLKFSVAIIGTLAINAVTDNIFVLPAPVPYRQPLGY